MKSDKGLYIGIDLGGTAVKGGLVQADGTIVEKQSIPTEADRGVDHVVGRMADLVRDLAAMAGEAGQHVAAVGLGVPGTLSHATGTVIAPPNLPGWRNVPIVRRLAEATGFRVTLENDANAAAWGEYVCGAGRGCRSMVMITLGTGVGGGFVFDGRLFRGSHEAGAEIGHMIVVPNGRVCACGQRGCLEAYASASSTAARALERLRAGEPSRLRVLFESGAALTSENVAEAAQQGDPLAGEVWRETCELLATACVSLQHIIDPERFVLAGGMSGAGERLLGPVRDAAARIASPMFGQAPEISLATLGSDAGLVGAALSACGA